LKPAKVKSINALANGIEVLQLLQQTGGSSLAEIHKATGIPKATILRILKTLHEKALIWQRMADNAYVPSWSLSEAAGQIARETELVEVASSVLSALSDKIEWPSVLAVPRLTHMEVIETNAPRAYFDSIRLGPIGFRVNMLRSASGRAYFANCEEPIRAAILDRLKLSQNKGDARANDPAYIARLISETRDQGFALRDPDFGGDFNEGRDVADDERDSLGVAIRLGSHVPGAINVTWSKRAFKRDKAIAAFAEDVQQAAEEIARRLRQK
jgi:IclR family mhp operon transcriptional activator